MIEASKLCKNFGRLVAVNHASFNIQPGEVVGFLGANGAGKTTTMRLLTGYIVPSFGFSRIAGFNVASDRKRAQSMIGYLPEAANGFPQLTVHEFLVFSGEARGIWRHSLKNAIDRVAELIHLQPSMNKKIFELSKGWRQRAWLAQALLHDPPVLILDEPTDGLDPNQKYEVRELLLQMSSDKAIVISTHILEEVDAVCSRAMIIAHGELLADGTPED